MRAKDASLTELCRKCFGIRDSDAWTELVIRMQPVFAKIAYRMSQQWGRPNRQEIDDVVQEMFLKLGVLDPRKLDFAQIDGDAATSGYLQAVGANAARDYFRAKYATKRGEKQTGPSGDRLQELVAGSAFEDLNYRVLLREIDSILSFAPRDRVAFWLYYRDGLTAKEIAAMPVFDLSSKGVESLLLRLTARIRECFREGVHRVTEEGKVPPDTFHHE